MASPLSAFLDDGYTREFCVAPVAGLHPGLKGTFRPATRPERNKFVFQKDKFAEAKDDDGYTDMEAATISAHLLTWEAPAKYDPKKAEHVKKLHPELVRPLLDQVLGYIAAEKSTEPAAKLEDTDAKNS